jgi:hypothetical protein
MNLINIIIHINNSLKFYLLVKIRVLHTPGFKPKPNAHSMCVQESILHTYLTKNGYKITNVIIEYIYYRIMSYKRLSRTLSKAQ